MVLDCGHYSSKSVKIKGKTFCLKCYKESKYRRSKLKEMYKE